MGIFGWLFFNDKDNVIVDEIVKLHKIDASKREVVKQHYEDMLKKVAEDVKVED